MKKGGGKKTYFEKKWRSGKRETRLYVSLRIETLLQNDERNKESFFFSPDLHFMSK